MSSGHEKSGQSRSSYSRADSIPSHLPVYTSVPFPEGLGGGEHASTPAHVTVSSLTGPVGTTSSDTRNTSYSTTGTPGFGTSLVTGFSRYGICLKQIGCKKWDISD